MKRWFVLALVLAIALPMAAAEEKKPQMSAEELAMMEAWQKAATPGDAHKALAPFVGTWDVKVKSWMAPGAPVMESAGTAENTWALDGRWVEQRFTGNFMGAPFSGVGYTGYDNLKGHYVGWWADNMSTAPMVSAGTRDGNVFKFNSVVDDPLTKKSMEIKESVTVTDNDHHTMEMWAPGPDGKLYKSMEIVYSRKK